MDEFIPYPPDIWDMNLRPTMGIANGKIIFYDLRADWGADVLRIDEYSYSFNRSEWTNCFVETTDEVKKIILMFGEYSLHFLRVENLRKER